MLPPWRAGGLWTEEGSVRGGSKDTGGKEHEKKVWRRAAVATAAANRGVAAGYIRLHVVYFASCLTCLSALQESPTQACLGPMSSAIF